MEFLNMDLKTKSSKILQNELEDQKWKALKHQNWEQLGAAAGKAGFPMYVDNDSWYF